MTNQSVRAILLRLLRPLAIAALVSDIAAAAENFHWVQYVPGGVEARATTDKAECPAAAIDGVPVAMSTRSAPGPNYPVRVCAAPVPAGARVMTVAGVPLPLPVAHPNRILVIGDTGCRLKGKQIQACNDATLWPFRVGSDIATTMKPDLVLHVGDFHYRESACPEGNAGCAGTPFGDTWDVWRADFFAPAELLLNAAPWIFVRGNHEECDRGGKGWARSLDSYAWSAEAGATGCLGPARPFPANIGGVTVVVMDVSSADEDEVNEKQAAMYREHFLSLKDIAASGPVWLTFHRPIWSTDGSKGNNTGGDNKTLAAAAKGYIPANVQAIFSGHQHKFEVDAYEEDLPIQVVSGHGGDDISPSAPANPVGIEVNGMHIRSGWGKPRTYGFSMVERTPGDADDVWSITDYDVFGKPLGRCRAQGRALTCN